MRKKIILIVFIILIVSLWFIGKFSGEAKTIEEAINTPGTAEVTIIHEEESKKGSIVFSYTEEETALYTAIVRKTLGGYKTVYSGVQGDIKLVAEHFGLSYNYFPAIKKTELPIYFGIIGDPDISKVKVIEKKRDIEADAKIINENGTRIWLVYMNQFEGSEFDIIGIADDGKEVVTIEAGISPWYAEQKDFEGYK